MPGTGRSHTSSVASGVTSRGESPVPPHVMTTSEMCIRDSAKPAILMLDEPFSALDAHLKSELEQSLLDLFATYEGSILYVSHDIDEAFRFCDRIAVVSDGKMCIRDSRVGALPEEIDPSKAKIEHEAECSLTLSCLAALDEAALISAACSNVEVRYESGDCACCPNAQGELIAALGEQATHFLGAFLAAATSERPLPAARVLPAAWSLVTPNDAERATTNTSPELSRRGLFDHFIERTTDSIAEAAVGTFYVSTTAQDQKRTLTQSLFADKGILKHIEAARNERVLNELYRFDPEWADRILPEKDDAVLPTRLFGEVTVDEIACDLCGICMTFCPTGALSGVANEPVNSFVMLNRDIASKGELNFRANDCMACNLCLEDVYKRQGKAGLRSTPRTRSPPVIYRQVYPSCLLASSSAAYAGRPYCARYKERAQPHAAKPFFLG